MKLTISTTDEMEMRQLLAAKDCLSTLFELQEYVLKQIKYDAPLSPEVVLEIINQLHLEDLWV